MATVLIVDDEPDIRLFAQINLELSEHRVLTAGDGREALDTVARELPDLVLLDVMMPGIDGWEVLRQLKQSGEDGVRNVPVIMLTALGSDQDQALGGIEGAVRYLVKPVSPDELVEAVDAALTGDPEPVQRQRARTSALERLARIERGRSGGGGDAPRPRLTRLEHTRPPAPPPPPDPLDDAPADFTARQRVLLLALRDAASVTAAAEQLSMSRSNVYASLRRIGRKIGITDVGELLQRLRSGDLDPTLLDDQD